MEIRKKTKSKKQNPSEWGSVPIFPEPPPPTAWQGQTWQGPGAHPPSCCSWQLFSFLCSQDRKDARPWPPSPGACTPHWQHHDCLLGALDQREASFSSDSRISTLEQGI